MPGLPIHSSWISLGPYDEDDANDYHHDEADDYADDSSSSSSEMFEDSYQPQSRSDRNRLPYRPLSQVVREAMRATARVNHRVEDGSSTTFSSSDDDDDIISETASIDSKGLSPSPMSSDYYPRQTYRPEWRLATATASRSPPRYNPSLAPLLAPPSSPQRAASPPPRRRTAPSASMLGQLRLMLAVLAAGMLAPVLLAGVWLYGWLALALNLILSAVVFLMAITCSIYCQEAQLVGADDDDGDDDVVEDRDVRGGRLMDDGLDDASTLSWQ